MKQQVPKVPSYEVVQRILAGNRRLDKLAEVFR